MKEIRLIKDLYKHFQPQVDVTDELINSCYNQYGSIRGILMNLILKFQPNVDVTDEYLDKKLSEYGLLIKEENKIIVEKDVVKIEEVTPVAEESPAIEDIPKEENSKVEAVENEEKLQEPTKVTQKETASSDSKKKSKTSLIVTLLIVGTIGLVSFLNQDMLLGLSQSQSIYDELSRMDKEELRIARNTVYAKHGRTFKSNDLVKYFNSTIWYKVNTSYSDAILSQEDLDLISVIKCWETDSELIWSKKLDLNNDDIIDYVFLLKDAKDDLFLIVNNKSINIQTTFYGPYVIDSVVFESGIPLVNICHLNNSYGGMKVLNFCLVGLDQSMDGAIDYLFAYHNNEIISTSIDNVNSLTTLDDPRDDKSYLVFETGFCQTVHKKYYEFDRGRFIIFKEEEYDIKATEQELMEMGRPCAACFVAGSKVLQDQDNYILIEELSIGDSILSYDIKTNTYKSSIVLDLVSVKHSNLVELYFDHDTIISTTDHPYFIFGKGWSSFDSLSTEMNYTNYDNIHQIQINDFFMFSTGEKYKLQGYSFKNELSKTFTITKLDEGNTFFLNRILVGVEEIRPDYSFYFKR
jgi:hypothetical protein